jgi:hypothetical protein
VTTIPRQQLNRWCAARLALVVLAGVGGWWEASSQKYDPDMDWLSCWVLLTVIAVTTFVGITYSYKSSQSSASWTKPSWSQNLLPLSSQPLQNLHLVAIIAMAEGIGRVLRVVSIGRYDLISQQCMHLFVGLGLWIPMRVWTFAFRSRLDESGDEQDRGEINQPSPLKQSQPRSGRTFKLLFIVLVAAIGVTNIIRFEYRTKGSMSFTGVLCVAAWSIGCALFFLYARRRLGSTS